MASAGMAIKAGYPHRQGLDVNPQREIYGDRSVTARKPLSHRNCAAAGYRRMQYPTFNRRLSGNDCTEKQKNLDSSRLTLI